DHAQASQSQLMTWMMPLLFTFMAFSFPSGLALYWVTSSIFRIILQYRISGWGSLRRRPAAETEQSKKYVKFDNPETKKMTIKDKDEQVIITDKESLKKSRGSFSWRKLMGLGEKDDQDQNK
ncbi:MAG: YidC/Oxa1 family membrane protein insertase, partial [Dehalococcoidales bacterium]